MYCKIKNVYFFVCSFFVYYLCEKYYKPVTVWYYIAHCVSWVLRLNLLDLGTNGLTNTLSEWNLFIRRGLTVSVWLFGSESRQQKPLLPWRKSMPLCSSSFSILQTGRASCPAEFSIGRPCFVEGNLTWQKSYGISFQKFLSRWPIEWNFLQKSCRGLISLGIWVTWNNPLIPWGRLKE